MGKPITLQDVADYCGVSHQTVSRVINESPNVAETTRQRVMAAIEALKGVGAEEQEAACVALEENHGAEVGARARALLRIEERAVEITKKLEAAVVEPEPVAEVSSKAGGVVHDLILARSRRAAMR